MTVRDAQRVDDPPPGGVGGGQPLGYLRRRGEDGRGGLVGYRSLRGPADQVEVLGAYPELLGDAEVV